MWVKKEYNFLDLKKECNAKAIEVLDEIERSGKEASLMELLEGWFEKTVPSIEDISQMLIIDKDIICRNLKIRGYKKVTPNSLSDMLKN